MKQAPQKPPLKVFLTTQQLAESLAMTPSAIVKLSQRDPSFPQPVYVGSGPRPRRRWHLDEVRRYLETLQRELSHAD